MIVLKEISRVWIWGFRADAPCVISPTLSVLMVPVTHFVLVTPRSVPSADTMLLDCKALDPAPCRHPQDSSTSLVPRVQSTWPIPLLCSSSTELSYHPPSRPGQNPRASLTFSLPFTSGTQHPAGSSPHIAPKPAVKTVHLDLEPNGSEPDSHSSACFHGILSPSSVLELSRSRLRSWLQVSFCDPCLGFEEPPVLLLTWHSSHWVGGLAVGGPCPLLSLLPWALGLMHNRCSANICRMIVDTDWELCTKCLAKWVACTISLDKSRIGEPSRRWWLAKSNQLASTTVRVVERSRWILAVCAVWVRGAGVRMKGSPGWGLTGLNNCCLFPEKRSGWQWAWVCLWGEIKRSPCNLLGLVCPASNQAEMGI